MAHLEQIALTGLDGVDLLPLAFLKQPVSFFEGSRRIKFEREHDDLDEYEIAALALANDAGREPTILALRSYRGAPAGTVDVMLPAFLKGEIHEIERVVLELAIELHIDSPLIGWVGHPVDQTGRVRSNQHPP